jgi:hypothetical protein
MIKNPPKHKRKESQKINIQIKLMNKLNLPLGKVDLKRINLIDKISISKKNTEKRGMENKNIKKISIDTKMTLYLQNHINKNLINIKKWNTILYFHNYA